MKTRLFSIALAATSTLQIPMAAAWEVRTLENWKAVTIHDSGHFEESLSVDEYPEVLVRRENQDGLSIKVGANLDWEERAGDTIKPLPTVGLDKAYSFIRKGENDSYILSIQGQPRSRVGSLLVRENRPDAQTHRDIEMQLSS